MNNTTTAELPPHMHVPDAENGLPTPHQNGRPNTSDLIERIAKDLPRELQERLRLNLVYQHVGD